jgi:tetratricopeptide (TPR) repeat protein
MDGRVADGGARDYRKRYNRGLEEVSEMIRFRNVLAGFLIALAGGAAALHAIAQARVWGTITDENGKPVPDVAITVTLPGVDSFKTVEKTDSKGEYAVTLLDATRTYTYTLEKDGYQTLRFTLKVPISSNERHDYQILSMAEAERRGPSGRELSPQDRAVLIFNEGAEASQMGDVATARSKFQEAVGLDPQLAPAYVALGMLSYDDKDYAKAVELGEKAYAIDPKDAKGLRLLVAAYQKAGDDAKSKAYSEQLAAVDPTAGAAETANKGIELYNSGDTAGAQKLFEQAVEADPDNARAHYMLGLCLAGSDPASAKAHLEAFLRLAPDDPDAATAKEMLKYLK